MGIPDWNKLETVNRQSDEENRVDPVDTHNGLRLYSQTDNWINEREVVIQTMHHGTQYFSEVGITRLSLNDVLDFAVEQGYLGGTDRAAGNIPPFTVLQEWGEELFEQDWDVHDYTDYESGDTLDYHDSYVEDVDIRIIRR